MNILFFIAIFITIITDLKNNKIKITIMIPLIALGLITAWAQGHPGMALKGMFIGYGVLAMIRWGGNWIFKRESLGKGDLILNAALGAWSSAPIIFYGTLYAFILGGIVGTTLIITGIKSRKDTIPFGPVLIAGAGLAWWMKQ